MIVQSGAPRATWAKRVILKHNRMRRRENGWENSSPAATVWWSDILSLSNPPPPNNDNRQSQLSFLSTKFLRVSFVVCEYWEENNETFESTAKHWNTKELYLFHFKTILPLLNPNFNQFKTGFVAPAIIPLFCGYAIRYELLLPFQLVDKHQPYIDSKHVFLKKKTKKGKRENCKKGKQTYSERKRTSSFQFNVSLGQKCSGRLVNQAKLTDQPSSEKGKEKKTGKVFKSNLCFRFKIDQVYLIGQRMGVSVHLITRVYNSQVKACLDSSDALDVYSIQLRCHCCLHSLSSWSWFPDRGNDQPITDADADAWYPIDMAGYCTLNTCEMC